MNDKLHIGLPTHRFIALTVLQKLLLSNGACSNVPRIGRIQFAIVADVVDHGYNSLPCPHRATQPV